ncbi:chemotaxis protein CheW [Roseateles sp. P5_E7]
MALHPDTPAGERGAQEVLTFLVGGENYAVELLQVQEIRRFEAPTRLANAARSVRGLLDLRGTIVTVVDLRTILGSDDSIGAATATVILNVGGRISGLVVDAVDDVVSLRTADIQRPPRLGVTTRLVQGLITVAASQAGSQRTLQLLDTQALMATFAPASLEAA